MSRQPIVTRPFQTLRYKGQPAVSWKQPGILAKRYYALGRFCPLCKDRYEGHPTGPLFPRIETRVVNPN